MLKTLQRSTLESLLVTHGGDFASAYADLADEVDGDALVSESLAKRWADEYTKKEMQAEARGQLARVVGGQGLATKAADFSKLERDKKLASFDEEFLSFAHTLVSDHAHEVFEPRDRVSGIPKVAELLGTPMRLQRSKAGPREAHRAMPHVAYTFGSLKDWQVMGLYVREGENVDTLTRLLITLDGSLSYLTPETVAEKLRRWRHEGVDTDTLDEEGQRIVLEWDEAIRTIRAGMGLLEAPKPYI